MNRRSELNGRHECNGFIAGEIEFNGVNQMTQINLNVHEYVQDLNTARDVDGHETAVTVMNDQIAAERFGRIVIYTALKKMKVHLKMNQILIYKKRRN